MPLRSTCHLAFLMGQGPGDVRSLLQESGMLTLRSGGSWSGNMSVGKEAYLQIQWIELVYNTTGSSTSKRDDQSCFNICSIDETEKIGAPVLLQGSASSILGQMGSFAGMVSWVSVLSMVTAFW